jgi:hypothetical protein
MSQLTEATDVDHTQLTSDVLLNKDISIYAGGPVVEWWTQMRISYGSMIIAVGYTRGSEKLREMPTQTIKNTVPLRPI